MEWPHDPDDHGYDSESRQGAFHTGFEAGEEEEYTLQTFSYASAELPPGAKMSAKVPPSWSGGEASAWFAFEELVQDWVDLTTLDVDKRGPALKSRLTGSARDYRTELVRTKLKEPNGVNYFLETLRPFYVRGREHVFLYLSLIHI